LTGFAHVFGIHARPQWACFTRARRAEDSGSTPSGGSRLFVFRTWNPRNGELSIYFCTTIGHTLTQKILPHSHPAFTCLHFVPRTVVRASRATPDLTDHVSVTGRHGYPHLAPGSHFVPYHSPASTKALLPIAQFNSWSYVSIPTHVFFLSKTLGRGKGIKLCPVMKGPRQCLLVLIAEKRYMIGIIFILRFGGRHYSEVSFEIRAAFRCGRGKP
jgi:hypothetical protein